MEIYRERKKDLQVFIELQKAYDRVSRKVLWWVLEKKIVNLKYINVIKAMYEEAATSVRTMGRNTNEFPITMGLH